MTLKDTPLNCGRFIAAIDLLRFAAALSVMWFHYAFHVWNISFKPVDIYAADGNYL